MTNKPFEDCFNRIIDTSLKCPRCQGPIFHGKGKANPEVGFNQIYTCSCLALDGKRFNKYNFLNAERWGSFAQMRAGKAHALLPGIALLPWTSHRPNVRAESLKTTTRRSMPNFSKVAWLDGKPP